jgi:hypothetical protein
METVILPKKITVGPDESDQSFKALAWATKLGAHDAIETGPSPASFSLHVSQSVLHE